MEAIVIHRHDQENDNPAFSWARVAGIAFVISIHIIAILLLLAPATIPKSVVEKQRTKVSFIKLQQQRPQPPPPQPQPVVQPQPQPPKPIPPKPIPPKPKPKPHLKPPIVTPRQPRPVDVPPSPPPAPAPVVPAAKPIAPAPRLADAEASVDSTFKELNKPVYPASAKRLGITGTVILLIDVDAEGQVISVSVERSSRNRDLDRSAIDAANHWRFNPKIQNGKKVPGRVRVPVDFVL